MGDMNSILPSTPAPISPTCHGFDSSSVLYPLCKLLGHRASAQQRKLMKERDARTTKNSNTMKEKLCSSILKEGFEPHLRWLLMCQTCMGTASTNCLIRTSSAHVSHSMPRCAQLGSQTLLFSFWLC